MKNHQAQPTRATVVPEAHHSENQRPKCHSRHGRGGQKPPRLGQRAKAYLKEEIEPISVLTSLPRSRTSRIRAKHLIPWMQIYATIVVQMTIGPVFVLLPRSL
ncbi:hypothetical protein ACFX2I_046377 [Malus domestica]